MFLRSATFLRYVVPAASASVCMTIEALEVEVPCIYFAVGGFSTSREGRYQTSLQLLVLAALLPTKFKRKTTINPRLLHAANSLFSFWTLDLRRQYIVLMIKASTTLGRLVKQSSNREPIALGIRYLVKKLLSVYSECSAISVQCFHPIPGRCPQIGRYMRKSYSRTQVPVRWAN
jgi:hypothetical protein